MPDLKNPLENKDSKSIKLLISLSVLALLGIIDSVYLTIKYYEGSISCSIISGCQEVLVSRYSAIYGIPISIMGIVFYLGLLIMVGFYLFHKKSWILKILNLLASLGFIFSLYLTYLENFVIRSLCQYCLLSALISTIIFIINFIIMKKNK